MAFWIVRPPRLLVAMDAVWKDLRRQNTHLPPRHGRWQDVSKRPKDSKSFLPSRNFARLMCLTFVHHVQPQILLRSKVAEDPKGCVSSCEPTTS